MSMYLYLNTQVSFCPDVFVRSFKKPTSLPVLTPIIFFKLLISWPKKRGAFVLPTGNSLLSNSIKFSLFMAFHYKEHVHMSLRNVPSLWM